MNELTVNQGDTDHRAPPIKHQPRSRRYYFDAQTDDFAQRVRVNQTKLRSELKPYYDFIIFGSASSGSVVAGRLAENPDVDVPTVIEADRWMLNLGSERDWAFMGPPNPHLNGRILPSNTGKVLGGGSSINAVG